MKILSTRLSAVGAVITATALGITACGGGSTSSGGASSGATLTLGVLTQATTFEAANANWSNEAPFEQAVYDTLLKASPKNEVEANLATDWSYDAKNTTLTMTLRSDVKFTDGSTFTADVAAQNLLRFKKGTSANASELANLKDAKATDDTHLVLTLVKPDPALLNYLTQNAGLMESAKAFTSADVKTNPVGSGPYVLDTKSTKPGSTYVFTKNPSYWNAADQHYGKLVMNVYDSGTSLLNAIRGGQVNAASTFDNTTLDQIKATGWNVAPLELNWEGLILFDRDGKMSPALGNVKVRQAINYALDRNGLLKVLSNGYGTVTGQVFPTSSAAYDASLDSTYSYDPAKAKQLLTEAGYPNGVTISMPSVSSFQQAMDLIKQQLDAVGITVKYTSVPPSDFISSILAPKFPATFMQLQEDTNDWQLASYQFGPAAIFNPLKTTTPQLQSLLDKLQTASDTAAPAIAKQVNTYIVDQAWFAPLFRPQLSFVTDSKTSVTVQPGNSYPYLFNIKPAS
jgi:peptide/nickel transport system substrate-binding protein